MTWPPVATWAIVLVAGVGTYLLRASFLAMADRLAALPADVRELLRMVPAATMAALTLPALLRPEGAWALLGPRALAGVVAGLVAWRTGSVLATVIVGLGAVMALQALLA